MVAMLEVMAYNRPGVLDRIAGLIRRQGWNIESLSTADAKNGRTQITLSLHGLSVEIDALADSLDDMEGIAEWRQFTPENVLMRELLLLELPQEKRDFLQRHQLRLLCQEKGMLYAEFTGSPQEVAAMQALAAGQGLAAARKGTVILRKGES